MKRGISAVVATVLIILVTVAAIAIVWSVVLPIFRESVSFDDADIELVIVTAKGYTTWDEVNKTVSVQVSRGADEEDCDEIGLVFLVNGDSDTRIAPAPVANQMKTYYFELDSKPSLMRVFAILDGKNLTSTSELSNIPEGVVNLEIEYGSDGVGYSKGSGSTAGTSGDDDECSVAADCDDSNPCTEDVCSSGSCVYSNANEGVCNSDTDNCYVGVCYSGSCIDNFNAYSGFESLGTSCVEGSSSGVCDGSGSCAVEISSGTVFSYGTSSECEDGCLWINEDLVPSTIPSGSLTGYLVEFVSQSKFKPVGSAEDSTQDSFTFSGGETLYDIVSGSAVKFYKV